MSCKKEKGGLDVSHCTSGVCALAANCQAQIKEKSPSGSFYSSHMRTITIFPPTPALGHKSSSFSSTTTSSFSTAASSASRPRNRAYLSLRSCKQSDSKLPAIVTYGATVTTEPGEALRIAEQEGVKDRTEGKEVSVIRFEGLEEWRCQRV